VPEELRLYRAHPYTSYTLNERYRSRNGLNRHNALGYRGDEIAREKAPGAYRVLCLGGSTTYETGVPDYTKSFTVVLQKLLRERHERDDIEVINAGCPSWNSWESLVDLEFRGLDLEPDLVVVYCGTNEVHPRLVPPEAYRRDNTGFRKQWIDDAHWWERSVVLRRLGMLVGATRKNSVSGMTEIDYDGTDPAANLAANSPRYYEDNLENIVALSKHHGADVLIASWAWCEGFDDYAADPVHQQGFRETNAVSRRVAERNGVAFLDYAAKMPREPKFWHDGRHVNAEGAAVKARLFADFIDERFELGR
jgi:lysophospholipase L1-like esterase